MTALVASDERTSQSSVGLAHTQPLPTSHARNRAQQRLTSITPLLTTPPAQTFLVSHEAIMSFLFPSSSLHPLSRGRLYVLGENGPLYSRHSYSACLCPQCQLKVRDRRHNCDDARNIYAGALFAQDTRNDENHVDSRAAAATVTLPLSVTVNTDDAAAITSALISNKHKPSTPSNIAAAPINSSTITPQSLLLRLPAAAKTIAFSKPKVLPILPVPSWLCNDCRHHALTMSHLLGGPHGLRVCSERTISTMVEQCETDCLLRAYDCSRLLSLNDTRTFINAMQITQLKRAHRPFAREEILEFLSQINRFSNNNHTINTTAVNNNTSLTSINSNPNTIITDDISSLSDSLSSSSCQYYSFDELRALIEHIRQESTQRLAQMFPSLTEKGQEIKEQRLLNKSINVPHYSSQLTTEILKGVNYKINDSDESKEEKILMTKTMDMSSNSIMNEKSSMLSSSSSSSSFTKTVLLRKKMHPSSRRVLKLNDTLQFALTSRLLHRFAHTISSVGAEAKPSAATLCQNVVIVRDGALECDRSCGWIR